MAGRKDKNVVDYFPHYVTSGKTMFVLESQFGHEGYAIWFKTLELLGSSENHYIDLRDDTDLLFIISKFKTTFDRITEIYNLLARLGAIDKIMWQHKIVFSENFLKNIDGVYRKRKNEAPTKNEIFEIVGINCISGGINAISDGINAINDATNTQSKVKESIVKESIEKSPASFENKETFSFKNKKEKKEIATPEILDLISYAKNYFDEKYISGADKIFDELIRIDEYAPDQIKKAIRQGKEDVFWTKNFLTPKKLRSKDKNGVVFIDIFLKLSQANVQKQNGGTNVKSFDKNGHPNFNSSFD
jgi:hypothetical protein